MSKKEAIHGFYLNFDDADCEGIYYLQQDLQYREAKTLFDAARRAMRTPCSSSLVPNSSGLVFEDDHDGDWSLNYNSVDGTYTLLRRAGEE